MSIGFFIPPGDALMWRGPMATNALRQMIHQTLWGPLDFLLLDLPPGTGDVHLSVISEMKVDGALIVTTPQRVALADVVRGVHMFRNEKVNIPILGLVENMAWFTPAELPDNRYYIFGEGEAARIAEQEKLPLLASIPLIRSVSEAADSGRPSPQKTCRTENSTTFWPKVSSPNSAKQSLTITFSLYDDNSLRTRRFFLTSES